MYTYRDLNDGDIPSKTSADKYFSFGAWDMYLSLKKQTNLIKLFKFIQTLHNLQRS